MNADFTPTEATISLHGLGFLQIKLPENRRIHIWHPSLPRRKCYKHSAIHNHRFSFRSTVLKGVQENVRYDLVAHLDGSHDLISHDGPRSEKGGRISYLAGRVNIVPREPEIYMAGQSYVMPELEYHETPNSGIVITLMEKLSEGKIHACSTIKHGETFDFDFDRFQLSTAGMWAIANAAFEEGTN